MADQRIVYGARCTWWGSIREVSTLPSGLPCCPHCGSPLFEASDEAAWWAGVDRYDRESMAGYRAKIEWIRGRCIPLTGRKSAVQVICDAYDAAHGTEGAGDV